MSLGVPDRRAGRRTVKINRKLQDLDTYYNAQKSIYEITIVTKSSWFSWFGSHTVNVTIFGDKAKTQVANLADKDPDPDDEVHQYLVEDVDIGNIEYFVIENNEIEGDIKWFLETVHVKKDEENAVCFPIFTWITNKTKDPLIFLTNKTVLPQKESRIRSRSREISHEIVKKNVNWSHEISGFPGSSGFLPPVHLVFTTPEMKVDDSPDLSTFLNYPTIDVDIVLQEGNDDDDEYKKMFKRFEDPKENSQSSDGELTVKYPKEETLESKWVENWKSDEEFGRQAMNGSLPILIKRIRKLPSNFAVNDSMLSGLLKRNLTMEEEFREGNMYLQDYKMFDDIEGAEIAGRKLDVASPLVLFYLRPDEELVPVAIQLGQTPGDKYPIWTPKDTPEDWMLAKMWVRNTEAQAGQLYYHLPYCHFGMEVFCMALIRCLSNAHPIHKLLRENFQNILEVNSGGRNAVFNAPLDMIFQCGNQGTQKLIRKQFSQMDFSDLDYMKNLDERDIDDLPNFHQRDDARKMWFASCAYIYQVIDFFYGSDASVKEDSELQDFAQEIMQEGFGHIKTKSPNFGIPTTFETKDDLKNFVVRIFFTTTSLHSSFNFFEYHRFMPACPYQIHSPLPTEKDRGKTTFKDIFDNIPTREKLGPDLCGAYDFVTAAFTPQQTWIQQTPRWLFTEPELKDMHDKFVDNLKEIEKEIDDRNAGLKIPFTVLKPSRIPAGIAI